MSCYQKVEGVPFPCMSMCTLGKVSEHQTAPDAGGQLAWQSLPSVYVLL